MGTKAKGVLWKLLCDGISQVLRLEENQRTSIHHLFLLLVHPWPSLQGIGKGLTHIKARGAVGGLWSRSAIALAM